MSDKNFLNEVILSIFDDSLNHDMQESVTLIVRHHGIKSDPDEILKHIIIEFGSGYMNWSFSITILNERTWFAMLNECINHERVTSQDSLVES